MPDTCFLKPAVDYVKALHRNLNHVNVFEYPNHTSVASAMSMLSHTAQFIENSVNSDHRMHNISIIIACRVRKGNRDAKDPTFLLWNTFTQNKQCFQHHTTPHQPRRPGAENECNAGIPSMEPSQPSQPSHPSQPSQPSQPLQISQHLQPSQPSDPSQLLSQSVLHSVPKEQESYEIPLEISSNCLHFLLDGSGFSSHKNLFQTPLYGELGSKTLVDALQNVFDVERHSRSRLKADSSSKSTSLGSGKPDDMIYIDLLPDHLRPKTEKGCKIVSVPDITFSPKGEPVVTKIMKVGLNIRKPDRNKKNQNFAILCALLHHTGPTGICAKVLRVYAEECFSEKGCKRRRKFSTSSKSSCNGSNLCTQAKRNVFSFYISSDPKPVGTGTVEPLTQSCDGKKVPEGSMIVRFGLVSNFEDITFPSTFNDTLPIPPELF